MSIFLEFLSLFQRMCINLYTKKNMGPGIWLPIFKDPKVSSVLFPCYKSLNLLELTVLLLK